jgi:glycosyltransferase involved in cell wall biosynthesis
LAVAVEKYAHHALGVTRWVDRFLCPSAFLADKLVEFGVPAERVRHLPNFVHADRFDPTRKLGSYWLYAGRLTQEKGVDTLLAAAALLPDRELRIAGEGPLRVTLEQQAARLGNVRFLGHLSRTDLAEQIAEAGAVAVPSIWYENFPYAVTEAQASARPVVASRIGGIPEQIMDGVDGRLVPAGDATALAEAVGALFSDPVSAEAMGRAGRSRVEKALCPALHLRRIERTYADLVGTAVGG